MKDTVFCLCQQEQVDRDFCDHCSPSWVDSADLHEEPPLYPVGKLASMTVEELKAEARRQADRQGRLGDCDPINERELELVEMRCRLVADELRARRAREGA